ncbi:MAG TPA: branched-chain amino acid ABC transporter ATP-binding protein/permease [Mycobacteriales bacterium]|nr:branched-chain amino acid ABC transporter ATP-binding protein/permease [Mycobacteriales bacterium]
MRRPELLARIGVAAVLLLALLAPLGMNLAQTSIVTTALTVGIVALGLDVLVGTTGQLSLAHAALYGVGCYAALGAGTRGTPWPLAFALGVAATAAVAVVIGLPSLRIRGLQVAVATLAFQVFAQQVPSKWAGVKSVGHPFERPSYLVDETHFYYLAVACVVLVLVLLGALRRTRGGRALLAVRDVESRAAAFGITPGRAKLFAYGVSGAVAGLGGALFALQQSGVNDTGPFILRESLLLVAVVVVGGARSPLGILAAALLVKALPPILGSDFGIPLLHRPAEQVLPAALALLLVVSVVLQPSGIGGVLRDLGARFGDPDDRPSPRPAPTDAVEATARARDLRDVPRPLVHRLPTAALLVAKDVSVRYGGVQALVDLDLEVRRSEIVGLIGANGAGKSTFFNAVSGLAPTTGSIRYRDHDLLRVPPAARSGRGVARTFQDMGLVRGDTVRENVLLAQTWMADYPAVAGLLALGSTVATERELRRRADEALELFGLRHLADERLGDLPYGTMRVAEIASAVASGPDLLLLDEASAGLTPDEAHALGDRFQALRDELGLTLVVIEHHVPLIARTCDYCYCLESGALIAEGTPAEVVAQPRVVESFLGRGTLEAAR